MKYICKIRINSSLTVSATYESDTPFLNGSYTLSCDNEKCVISDGKYQHCIEILDKHDMLKRYEGKVELMNQVI